MLLLSEDSLQIDSRHHFCTIDVIETNKANYNVRSVGVNPYAIVLPNNYDMV